MSNPPVVTLIVLCWNQARFIGEAIDSALVQTWSPLEIIVSDDASSDESWSCIEARAAAYRGRHALRIRRETRNLGTLDHVLNAAGEATGDLIVLAAGDDMSEPERVEHLAQRWERTGAAAMCSDLSIISEDGRIETPNVPGAGGAQPRAWFDYPEDMPLVKGCTSAYERRFLASVPKCGTGVLHEDIALNAWMIATGRKAARVERPLLRYRRHGGAVSFQEPGDSYTSWMRTESRRVAQSAHYARLYRYLLEHLPNAAPERPVSNLDRALARIARAEAVASLRSGFYDQSVLGRARTVFGIRDRGIRRHFMARLLGMSAYAAARTVGSLLERMAASLPTTRNRQPHSE